MHYDAVDHACSYCCTIQSGSCPSIRPQFCSYITADTGDLSYAVVKYPSVFARVHMAIAPSTNMRHLRYITVEDFWPTIKVFRLANKTLLTDQSYRYVMCFGCHCGHASSCWRTFFSDRCTKYRKWWSKMLWISHWVVQGTASWMVLNAVIFWKPVWDPRLILLC